MAGTWIELDLGALRANIRSLRRALKSSTDVIVSLKADAYGHGLSFVCPASWECGAKVFIVDSVEDGLTARRLLPAARILLEGTLSHDAVKQATEAQIFPIVSCEQTTRELARLAADRMAAIECHVEIRTGITGRGFDWEKESECMVRLCRTPGMRVTGFCSHFTDAGNPDTAFAEVQMARFYRAVTQCAGARSRSVFRHMANAQAILRQPLWDMDGVRPGLLVYGYAPLVIQPARDIQVSPCLTWKTRLTKIRRVKGGHPTGCGDVLSPTGGIWVGDVQAGYADGYRRAREQPGYVLIRGRPYPLIGPVEQDSLSVNLGPEPLVSAGDEVVLMGSQKNETISAPRLAEWCGTVTEEILIGIRTTDKRAVRGRTR